MTSKHTFIMLLCCLVPLAGFFMVSVLGIPLNNLATVAMVLLCPLMHILLMRGMGGHADQGQQPSCHSAPELLSKPATVRTSDE